MEGATLTQEQILACALYEFHQGKPVDEAYQTFCKTMGDEAITYRDFDNWWHRFKDGLFDLDHDRNKDPKKPELLDIPVDVVEMIIGKLTLEEKLVLRNVSKSIREVVDNMQYSFENFWLSLRDDYSLKWDNEQVNFKNWKQALEVFLTMMNWPIMKMESLRIDIDPNEQVTTHVLEAFKSLNHQIPVSEVFFWPRAEAVLAVLPYLQPKILERICIFHETNDELINLNEVVKLDQWKQAKILRVHEVGLPIESLHHAEDIDIIVDKMSIDDFVKLKNAHLASSGFEYCDVKVCNKDDEKAILDAFENEIIPIPETNQLFEIEFGGLDRDGSPCTFAFRKTSA